jgi:hypothetical protein
MATEDAALDASTYLPFDQVYPLPTPQRLAVVADWSAISLEPPSSTMLKGDVTVVIWGALVGVSVVL